MSDNPVLLAEERSEFGKGAARPVTSTFPVTICS